MPDLNKFEREKPLRILLCLKCNTEFINQILQIYRQKLQARRKKLEKSLIFET